MTKPKFEELTLITLPGTEFVFGAQRFGPTTFKGLRENDYGEGFRMPTIPELVNLVYASLENKKEYKTAKNVVKTQKHHWITGNTAVHYFPKGMFVQDNPELKGGRIFMNQKTLQSKLGSREEKRVVFSDDGSIRFAPYGFKRGFQTPLELSINTGIIALFGGEKNAEEFAKASEHYKAKPSFLAVENVDSPITRVANLGSYTIFGNRLDVDANSDEGSSNKYSFGIFEGAEGILQKIKQEEKE